MDKMLTYSLSWNLAFNPDFLIDFVLKIFLGFPLIVLGMSLAIGFTTSSNSQEPVWVSRAYSPHYLVIEWLIFTGGEGERRGGVIP